ncbi:hypothetical protein [Rheinheimera faecalis]|uniref:hypothetical protein n=1 Tax=Rheinheimera faecalis TaxID=2901141 RepID=UPI001E471515|nr:hypothetical protein [Rheinheimera faecalis]
MAGVDENGEPTAISHSADNLRTERAQHEQWRVDDIEFAMKSAQQQGLYGWSYDSGQSGLINEGLIGAIVEQEMSAMSRGMFISPENQGQPDSTSPNHARKQSKPSGATGALEGASSVGQYLGTAKAGLDGLGKLNFGIGYELASRPALSNVDSVMQQLGLGSHSSLASSVDGRVLQSTNHYLAFGDTSRMTAGYGAVDLLDTSFMSKAEPFLKWGGPVVSALQATDYTWLQNDGAGHNWSANSGCLISHWGKVGVDIGFAIVGGLPGAAYTVTDLTLSVTPEYKVRYGQSTGEMVNGWEKAGFYMVDKTQDGINRTVETGVGPRGVKLRPEAQPQTPVTPRGRR